MPPDTGTSTTSSTSAAASKFTSHSEMSSPIELAVGSGRTGISTSAAQPTSTATSTNSPPGELQTESKESESSIRFSRKFTCSICVLEFESSPLQREHMRGGWHVYNLKRKMGGLMAVSEDVYLEEAIPPAKGKKVGDVRRDTEGDRERGGNVYGKRSDGVAKRDGWSSVEDEDDEENDEDEEEEEDEWSDESSDNLESESESHIPVYNITKFSTHEGNALRLSSGKVIGKKNTILRHRKPLLPSIPHSQRLHREFDPPNHQSSSSAAANPTTEISLPIQPHTPSPFSHPPLPQNQNRTISLRTTLSLIGLTPQQRSALIKVEKRVLMLGVRKRGVVQRRVDFAGNKNSQKRYRIGGSRGGKKMGGLEKRNG